MRSTGCMRAAFGAALVLLVVAFTPATPADAQTAARPAGAATRSIERRIALVIGNSRYKHVPRLVNPLNDATLIADTLRRLGFTLVGGKAQIDLDKQAFDRAIRKFGEALMRGGVGLFYYAGHGIQIHGENYLVPVSANIASEADVDFELVNANVILRQMQIAGTRFNLVMLDACRNNPFGAGRGLRDIGAGLAQMRAPAGTLISYSTQPGQVALDGSGGNSPYALALADVIKRPGLDVFSVFNQVGIEVRDETAGQQEPWVSSSPIDGEFYFAGAPTTSKATSTVNPQTLPKGERFELTFWQSIQNSANPADYQAYLKAYPHGHFVALARARSAEAAAAQPAPKPQQLASLPPAPDTTLDEGKLRALAKARDVPLPPSFEVTPPPPDTPPAVAAFWGAWATAPDAQPRSQILVVHRVEKDGHAVGFLALGPLTKELGHPTAPPGDYYFEGKITDGHLKFDFARSAHDYRFGRNGTLLHVAHLPHGVTGHGRLQRIR